MKRLNNYDSHLEPCPQKNNNNELTKKMQRNKLMLTTGRAKKC